MAVDRGHMAASLPSAHALTRWEAQRYPDRQASGVVDEICFGCAGCREEVAGRLWESWSPPAPPWCWLGRMSGCCDIATGAYGSCRRACMVVVCASQGPDGAPCHRASGGRRLAIRPGCGGVFATWRPRVGTASATPAFGTPRWRLCRPGLAWPVGESPGRSDLIRRCEFFDPRCEGRPQIAAPTAMAFNPSVPGGKSEDTFLVTEEGRLPVTVSLPEWPQSSFNRDGLEIFRPDVLVL